MLYFNDEKMNEVLKDWKKMHDFLQDGFIDEEVYSLWIEKTLKNIQIKTIDKAKKYKGEFRKMNIFL